MGYIIPKLLDKQNRLTTPRGTKIIIKEKDLFTKRLIGNKYGMLTVIEYDYKRSEESYNKKEYYCFWLCKCDCGNPDLHSVNQQSLLTGKSTSCGCMFKKPRYNIVGNIYGRLKVISLDDEKSKKYNKSFWFCKCNCGNENLISIESDCLKRGDTQSCGCIWKEAISGDNNWNWNGGITELYQHLRNIIYPWTTDIFIKYDRKCIITNDKAEIVHHLVNFKDIVQETLRVLALPTKKQIKDYSIEEISTIDKLFIEKHYLYNCGIPLRNDIHNIFHKLYGYKNNNIEQFLDFVNKIFTKEIEIPYWTDDKNETWKKLIDNKINEILHNQKVA